MIVELFIGRIFSSREATNVDFLRRRRPPFPRSGRSEAYVSKGVHITGNKLPNSPIRLTYHVRLSIL